MLGQGALRKKKHGSRLFHGFWLAICQNSVKPVLARFLLFRTPAGSHDPEPPESVLANISALRKLWVSFILKLPETLVLACFGKASALYSGLYFKTLGSRIGEGALARFLLLKSLTHAMRQQE